MDWGVRNSPAFPIHGLDATSLHESVVHPIAWSPLMLGNRQRRSETTKPSSVGKKARRICGPQKHRPLLPKLDDATEIAVQKRLFCTVK
jgi:hypothetical protein